VTAVERIDLIVDAAVDGAVLLAQQGRLSFQLPHALLLLL
jgi:hypothetical protein